MGSEQLLVSTFAGVVAPFLIQGFRLASEKLGLAVRGVPAQIVTIIVSMLCAYTISGQLGSISADMDVWEVLVAVYLIAQLVYEALKAYLDTWLPSKQE